MTLSPKQRRMREIAKNAFLYRRSFIKWGCSHEEYLTLRGKKSRLFTAQRNGARTRGIGWEMNLWQWWSVWQQSGHWGRRGRGQGYVMCRKGDVGPYAIDNVFIAPAVENNAFTYRKLSTLPIGVAAYKNKFRAWRRLNGKSHYLGLHFTPEEAHAAYLSLGPIGKEVSA